MLYFNWKLYKANYASVYNIHKCATFIPTFTQLVILKSQNTL